MKKLFCLVLAGIIALSLSCCTLVEKNPEDGSSLVSESDESEEEIRKEVEDELQTTAFDVANYAVYEVTPVVTDLVIVTYEVLVHDWTEREAELVGLQSAVAELYNQGLYGIESFDFGSVTGATDISEDDLLVVIKFDSAADDDSVRAVIKSLTDLDYVQTNHTSQGDYLCIVTDTVGVVSLDRDGNETETEQTYSIFPIVTERDFRLYELRDSVLALMQDGTYEISDLGVGRVSKSDEEGSLIFSEFQIVTIGIADEENLEALRELLSEMGYTEATFDTEGDFYLEIAVYASPL